MKTVHLTSCRSHRMLHTGRFARCLMWHVLSIVLSLSLVPQNASAQTIDIRGLVSDSLSGEPVPFANVVLSGTRRGAATNVDGFFLLPNVDAGRHLILVSAVGYVAREIPLVVMEGALVTLRIRLLEVPVEMEEVVVVQTKRRELEKITTGVHVMDTRDLKMVPVTVQDDVLRSVQILPGVVSSSDVSSQFYVRGGATDQNMILLDGIRIYSPYHAFGIFSIFDSDMINATEVFTGAFPSEYGGRLSSVVNLTARDGRSTGMSATTNMNILSGKALIEGPLSEEVRILINARKSLFSKGLSSFFRTETPISFYDVFAKMTYDMGSQLTKFSFLTFQTGDDLPSAGIVNPDYHWRNTLYGIRAKTLFADRIYVSTGLSYTRSDVSRVTKLGSRISPASSQVSELSMRQEFTIHLGADDILVAGFEFGFPSIDYQFKNAVGIIRNLKETNSAISFWGRYQTTVQDLDIDAGLHVDGSSNELRHGWTNIFQPRIHIGTPIGNAWRLKGSYGIHTQRLITLSNEDDLIALFEPWAFTPENLRTQRAEHIAVALNGNVASWLSTTVEWYHKEYDGLIQYNKDKTDQSQPDYIAGDGTSSGIEVMMRFGVRPIDVYLAYTFGSVEASQGRYSYAPRYDRRHTLKTLASFSPLAGLDVIVRWEAGSGFPYTPTIGFYDRLQLQNYFDIGLTGETGTGYVSLGPKNSLRLPWYHRMDISGTYVLHLGRLATKLGVHLLNVYNRKNIFYFDRQTGQRIDMLGFTPTVTCQVAYQ